MWKRSNLAARRITQKFMAFGTQHLNRGKIARPQPVYYSTLGFDPRVLVLTVEELREV
jgi:hypothetical protein